MSPKSGKGGDRSQNKGNGAVGQDKPQLPKRFYTDVAVSPADDGYGITLDGRKVNTPGRTPFVMPARALAEAVAGEWQAQGDHINPATMPLTALGNSALDYVTPSMDAVRDEICAFAGGDMLLYRAASPVGLVERQSAAWDPVLAWVEAELGAHFELTEGLMPIPQAEDSLEKIAAGLNEVPPLPLAAISVVTTLTGSALLGLGLARGHSNSDAVWLAAHIDEDWQIEKWGRDEEAEIRRKKRKTEYEAAALVLRHCM